MRGIPGERAPPPSAAELPCSGLAPGAGVTQSQRVGLDPENVACAVFSLALSLSQHNLLFARLHAAANSRSSLCRAPQLACLGHQHGFLHSATSTAHPARRGRRRGVGGTTSKSKHRATATSLAASNATIAGRMGPESHEAISPVLIAPANDVAAPRSTSTQMSWPTEARRRWRRRTLSSPRTA